MPLKTIKVPDQLFRSAAVEMSGEGETKAFAMSISSDTPYKRYDWYNDEEYYEVLDHGPGGMDDTRLKAGLPILFNHGRDEHLARAVSHINDGHKCTVSGLIWSVSDFAQTKKRDTESGALPDTSVGYQITDEGECIGAKDGLPIYKFKWAPYEASLVTIPADITVGAGRGKQPEGKFRELQVRTLDNSTPQSQNRKHTAMADKPNTTESETVVDAVKERGEALTAERKRVKQINDYVTAFKIDGMKVKVADLGRQAIESGKEFTDFQQSVLDNWDGAQRVDTPSTLGLNEKEKKAFSLMRAINLLASKRPLDGLEKEVSDAAGKHARCAMRPDGIYLPEDITGYDLREAGLDERAFRNFQRANQNVTTATAGGFTVPTQFGSMIEYLRNSTVLGQVGITTLGGLQGDMVWPVQTGGAAAYWVSESGSGTDSAATFAMKALTPHRLSGTIPFTTQFLAQTSLSAEQFCRNELMTVSALAIDLAGLEGTGANGQPLGLKNTAGVGAHVTYSGAATWANVVLSETSINTANANIGSIAWILSSSAVGKWKTILKVTAGAAGQFLIENNEANGYPVYRTNQLSTNQSYFGVFSQMLHALWSTQEIIVDPYALKKTGGIEVTMNTFHDFLVRQPTAFEISTDSAAA